MVFHSNQLKDFISNCRDSKSDSREEKPMPGNFEFENSQEEAEKEVAADGDSDSSYTEGKKKKPSTNRTTAGQKKSSTKKTTTPRLATSSKSKPSTTSATKAATTTSTAKKRKAAGGSDSDVEHVTKPTTTTTTTSIIETKEPPKGGGSSHPEEEEEPLFSQSKHTSSAATTTVFISSTSSSVPSSSSVSSSSSSSSSSHHHSESSSHRDSSRSNHNDNHRTPRHDTRDSLSSKPAPAESSRDGSGGRDSHRRAPSREPRGSDRPDSRTDARSTKPRRESESFITSVPVSRLGKARPVSMAPTPIGRNEVRNMLDELVKRCALFGDVGSTSMDSDRSTRKRGERGEDSKDEEFPQDLFSPKTCRGVEDVLRVLDGRLLLLSRLVSHHLFLYPSVLDNFTSMTLPQKLRLVSKSNTRQRPPEHPESDSEQNDQGGIKDTHRIRAIMDELCEKYLLVGGPYSCLELDSLFDSCQTVKDALRLNPWNDLLPNIRLHALLNPHISKPLRNMSIQEKLAFLDPD